VSTPPFDSFNLGIRCGDVPSAVIENRRRLRAVLSLPSEPAWLHQVHGVRAIYLPSRLEAEPEADASWTTEPGDVCVVQAADCLPVLLADDAGRTVGAAHAGWRGLAGGVLENLVEALGADPRALSAWLGPAIGPTAFEVGPEVRTAFVDVDPAAARAFSAGAPGKFLADLFALARMRLARAGVERVHGGGRCTVSDPSNWYSFRRDARCGRMATLVWLSDH
jgi:YfiH family protein